MTTNDLMNPPKEEENNEDHNYLDQLVGEGKKFKDTEALAKSKLDSDEYIEQLKSELAGMREDLNKRVTVEEMLEKMTQKQAERQSSNADNQDDRNDDANGNQFDPKQIDELVNKKVNELSARQRKQANVEMVKGKLVEQFGQEYPVHLRKLAGDLGVSEDYLAQMAEDSPNALLKLVGNVEAPRRQTFDGAPRGSVNTAAMGGNKGGETTKNKAYFDKIRREDPKKYWTPAVQNELFAQRKALGDSFYN